MLIPIERLGDERMTPHTYRISALCVCVLGCVEAVAVGLVEPVTTATALIEPLQAETHDKIIIHQTFQFPTEQNI